MTLWRFTTALVRDSELYLSIERTLLDLLIGVMESEQEKNRKVFLLTDMKGNSEHVEKILLYLEDTIPSSNTQFFPIGESPIRFLILRFQFCEPSLAPRNWYSLSLKYLSL